MKKSNLSINLIWELLIFWLIVCTLSSHFCLFSFPLDLYYPGSISYHLQTNALLQGKLEIGPTPFGSKVDYEWLGHGLQQSSGMGVPLLWLPFEWLGKHTGAHPFPDALILLFYFALMIAILNLSIAMFLRKTLTDHYKKWTPWIRWGMILWILLCPTFFGLLDNFRTYEQNILYACIWVFILLGLFWLYILKPREKLFYMISLLSGFAVLIRPTLIFYGGGNIYISPAQ